MNLSDTLTLLRALRGQNESLAINDSDVVQILKELALEAVADHIYSKPTEVVLICLYTLIAATGFLSNAFILLVILTSRKLLSNPSSLLLANLMFSDIVMSLFCIPFTLIWFIRKSWPFGRMMCKVIPFVQGLSIFLCSSTIAVIAVDRIVRVTGNVVISNRPSPIRNYHVTQIALETLLIWCVSIMLALPALISQEIKKISLSEWTELGRNEYVKCFETMDRTGKLSYASTIVVAQYVVPVVILFFANIKIRNHLQRSLNKLKQNSDQFSEVNASASSDRRHLLREMNRNRKVIRTLFQLAATFMLAWLPWTLTNLYIEAFDTEIGHTLSLVLVLFHLMAMTSVPMNAFLYGWSNPTVRVEACRLWQLLSHGRVDASSAAGTLSRIPLSSMSHVRSSTSTFAHQTTANS